MSLYIDNGKTIKHYNTNKKIDKAIETLLQQMIEELCFVEFKEGCEIEIVSKEDKDDRNRESRTGD